MKRVHRRPGDAWQRYLARLRGLGIPAPRRDTTRRPATRADEQRLYAAPPSFVDLLPWVEYLPDSQSLLLEDGHSVAAFFELSAVGTEGRELDWLCSVRDVLENALQDSSDELDQQPFRQERCRVGRERCLRRGSCSRKPGIGKYAHHHRNQPEVATLYYIRNLYGGYGFFTGR